MFVQVTRIASVGVVFGLCVLCASFTVSQEPLPPIRVEPARTPGEIPKGVEVQARGPIHEAFAAPLTDPKATPTMGKKPPVPIEEMPPAEKPEGEMVWIGGYFAWDDDRADYLWVSGCWRVKPAGKEWVPGYWREVGDRWQRAPGFWTAVQEQKVQPVTYYPEPPAPPNVAPPGDPPGADTFHVPGYWMWNGARYVWRAGYWTRVRPGYVYVPSHYHWTPYGHVFVAGYWDLGISRRGLLYAPIYVDAVVVGPRYVYTPHYAIRDTIVLDTLFVRASFGAYYFGDYYGPRYVAIGFEPGVVYSRRYYEPILVYQSWVYRDNPRWHDTQITLVFERNAGRAPVPPRTVNVTNITNVTNVTNVTNINNVVGTTKTVVAAQGQKTVALDAAARAQVRQTALTAQHTKAADRRKLESTPAPGPLTAPRTTALSVPPTPPVGSTGLTKNPTILPVTKTDLGKGTTIRTPPRDSSKGIPIGRPTDKKGQPEDTKKKKGAP